MLKLYKRTGARINYHEAWVSGSKIVEHWGKLGERGNTREHSCDGNLDDDQNLEKVLADARAKGFVEIDLDDHATLLIEYSVEGMGSTEDLEKRHELQDRMNETLGWTGLGLCDGGSIGSDTMEVCCFVVDFEIAKAIISEDLKNTEFADYTRIYDENEG